MNRRGFLGSILAAAAAPAIVRADSLMRIVPRETVLTLVKDINDPHGHWEPCRGHLSDRIVLRELVVDKPVVYPLVQQGSQPFPLYTLRDRVVTIEEFRALYPYHGRH